MKHTSHQVDTRLIVFNSNYFRKIKFWENEWLALAIADEVCLGKFGHMLCILIKIIMFTATNAENWENIWTKAIWNWSQFDWSEYPTTDTRNKLLHCFHRSDLKIFRTRTRNSIVQGWWTAQLLEHTTPLKPNALRMTRCGMICCFDLRGISNWRMYPFLVDFVQNLILWFGLNPIWNLLFAFVCQVLASTICSTYLYTGIPFPSNCIRTKWTWHWC